MNPQEKLALVAANKIATEYVNVCLAMGIPFPVGMAALSATISSGISATQEATGVDIDFEFYERAREFVHETGIEKMRELQSQETKH